MGLLGLFTLPSTPSTVIVQSFAGLVPPKSVPAINKVSFVTNPGPKPVVVASYTVPVLVTVELHLHLDLAV